MRGHSARGTLQSARVLVALALAASLMGVTPLGDAAGAAPADRSHPIQQSQDLGVASTPVVDPAGCATTPVPSGEPWQRDLPLPFPVDYFGTTYTTAVVDEHYVWFRDPSIPWLAYTPTHYDTIDAYLLDAGPFDPGAGPPSGELSVVPSIIAPFIAPVAAPGSTEPPAPGRITYGTTVFEGRPAFCVTWSGIGALNWVLLPNPFGIPLFQAERLNTYQLLLVDRSDSGSLGDFEIVFNYETIGWDSGLVWPGPEGPQGGYPTSQVCPPPALFPSVVPCHNVAAGALAGGAVGPGEVMLVAGSSQLGAMVDESPTGFANSSTNSPVPGRHRWVIRNGGSVIDTDQDGVFDVDDNCDETPNPGQYDTDGDGVGNACTTPPTGPAPQASPNGATFVPLRPTRLFDTRTPTYPAGALGRTDWMTVTIAGKAGVPDDAVAVVMNVTATNAAGAGFVTVWPTGSTKPGTSNLNLTQAAQTRPNLVAVPLGVDGQVNVYAQTGAHLVADVAGYFLDDDDGTATAGRLLPLDPTRVFDTRRTGRPLTPGQTIDIQVTGIAGVPTTGVQAVALNLTATDTTATGFVTAWPTGQARPLASNLNLTIPGETTPNLVLVPVGDNGKVSFYNGTPGLHLLADVTGYITDDTAPADDTGLFFPIQPARIFDTRFGPGPASFVGPGTSVTETIAGVGGIAADASAVFMNLTGTEAGGPGFVTAWPTGQARPLASSLNLNTIDDTRPNATILPLGTTGQITLFTQSGAHLLGDATGYFN